MKTIFSRVWLLFLMLSSSAWADVGDDLSGCERELLPKLKQAGQITVTKPEEQYCLGLGYRFSDVLPRNPAEAARWHARAAVQGHPGAQTQLGYHYEQGDGVQKDYAEALKWYRKAADQGHADAMYHMGNLHITGKGVQKSEELARQWYRKAAEHGSEDAIIALRDDREGVWPLDPEKGPLMKYDPNTGETETRQMKVDRQGNVHVRGLGGMTFGANGDIYGSDGTKLYDHATDQWADGTLSPDATAQNPPGYIPSLRAKVSSLRFFEMPYNRMPVEQRVYSNRFEKARTRYVSWELKLESPTTGRRINFPIEQLWYRADGSLLARQSMQATIEPHVTLSYHSHGHGWKDPGNWAPGAYRVDLSVEGRKVASGSFEILGALEHFAAATEAKPLFNKGVGYHKKRMYDEAIAEFTKAIEIINKRMIEDFERVKKGGQSEVFDLTFHADVYYNRANSYMEKGQTKQAISDLTKAIDIDPDHADAYFKRGFIYQLEDQSEQAISDYTEVIRLAPKRASAYYFRGANYEAKDEYANALEDMRKAQELGYPVEQELLDTLLENSLEPSRKEFDN